MGSAALILLIIVGIAFAGGGILLSKQLAKTSKNKVKGEPYECGIPQQALPGYNLMLVIICLPLFFLYLM